MNELIKREKPDRRMSSNVFFARCRAEIHECIHTLPEGGEDEEELCLYESRHHAEETKTGSAVPRNPRKTRNTVGDGRSRFEFAQLSPDAFRNWLRALNYAPITTGRLEPATFMHHSQWVQIISQQLDWYILFQHKI